MIKFSLSYNLTDVGINLDKSAYRNAMNHLVYNSLVHLYLTVAESSRLVPWQRRNEILVRYLKPKLKAPQYRSIKKEIRTLLVIGRGNKRDLETKLLDLNRLHLSLAKNLSGAQRLFDLLEILKSEQGLYNRLIDEQEDNVPGIIYMQQDHIENGFDEAGEQVAAMSLFLESDKVSRLVEVIEKTGLFSAEMQQLNEGENLGHIVLHPVIMNAEH